MHGQLRQHLLLCLGDLLGGGGLLLDLGHGFFFELCFQGLGLSTEESIFILVLFFVGGLSGRLQVLFLDGVSAEDATVLVLLFVVDQGQFLRLKLLPL